MILFNFGKLNNAMKTDFATQITLMQEASEALIEKMGIAKASRFWTLLGFGKNDYTKIRKQLFAKETIKTLAKKIRTFEKKFERK